MPMAWKVGMEYPSPMRSSHWKMMAPLPEAAMTVGLVAAATNMQGEGGGWHTADPVAGHGGDNA
jgi:hypothetical protein